MTLKPGDSLPSECTKLDNLPISYVKGINDKLQLSLQDKKFEEPIDSSGRGTVLDDHVTYNNIEMCDELSDGTLFMQKGTLLRAEVKSVISDGCKFIDTWDFNKSASFQNIAIDSTGRIYVLFLKVGSGTRIIYSDNNGSTWTILIDYLFAASVDIVIDYTDILHIVRRTNTEIFYRTYSKFSGLSSEQLIHSHVIARLVPGNSISISIDTSNIPHFAWFEKETLSPVVYKLYHKTGVGGTPVEISTTFPDGRLKPKILIDFNDNLHMMWVEFNAADFSVTESYLVYLFNSDPVVVIDTGSNTDFTDSFPTYNLNLDSFNNPHFSWVKQPTPGVNNYIINYKNGTLQTIGPATGDPNGSIESTVAINDIDDIYWFVGDLALSVTTKKNLTNINQYNAVSIVPMNQLLNRNGKYHILRTELDILTAQPNDRTYTLYYCTGS